METAISMISDIKNWINWIIGALVCSFVPPIWKLVKFPAIIANPLAVEKLKNKSIVKVIGFIFSYLIPLSIIVYVFIDNSLEINFRNILFFILLCFTLLLNIIFDVIMPQIIKLFMLMIQKSKSDSEKLKMIDECFSKVYEHIESIKNKQV